jgi:hypothetical protein
MQDFDVKHEMEPEPAAWIRFQSYAQRIRSMSYVEDIPSERTDWRPSSILITDEAWDVIFRSRICMNVLPNLTTLTWARVSHERTWNHQFRFLQGLLHNQLRSLTLHIPWRDEETPSICRNIAFRAPQLTHLEIRSKSGLTGDDPDGTQSAAFTRMLSALIHLRTITVPAFWITCNVVQAASTLPHLIALTSSPITELNTGEPEDVKTFQPSLSDGCFPSLTTLEIACNIPHAVVFFGGLNHPCRMTNLSVSSPNLVARSRDISELLSALASSSPGLLHLHLDLRAEHDIFFTPEDEDSLDTETLNAVTRMSNLISFRFHHQVPLDIDGKQARKLVSCLPMLHCLELNPCPFALPETGWVPLLGLSDIHTFAECCPDLQELGVFIDVDNVDQNPSSALRMHAFRKPMKLNVGISPYGEDLGFTRNYLRQVCAAGCDLRSGYDRKPETVAGEFYTEDAKFWNSLAVSLMLVGHMACITEQ